MQTNDMTAKQRVTFAAAVACAVLLFIVFIPDVAALFR
jgi:hypothetical protein